MQSYSLEEQLRRKRRHNISKTDKMKLATVAYSVFGSLGLTVYMDALSELDNNKNKTILDIEWYKEYLSCQ